MAHHLPQYRAHRAFIAPALRRSDLWRVGVMLVGFEVAFSVAPDLVRVFLSSEGAAEYAKGVSAWATLLQFATFGVAAFIFVLLLRLFHDRGFWSLFGDISQAIVDFWQVFVAVCAVLLLLELIPPWQVLHPSVEMRDLIDWLNLLPIAVIALLIQVGTEEIYFRGYLQQQLACVFRSRAVWMLLPSVLFGLSHFGNGENTADGIAYAIWATALGLACADLTARTGNLGAAIGLHFANNTFALLIYAQKDAPSSGLALFLFPQPQTGGNVVEVQPLFPLVTVFETVFLCGSLLIMWLAARIALRR